MRSLPASPCLPTPRSESMASTYGWSGDRKDLLAGLTVAAISLPQAMAYALIAGIDPRYGLYSAIVVTAIASVFGSSSQLINGPTNAISLVVFSALAFLDPNAPLGTAYEATFLLAAMVGTIQILVAVFKLGDLTRYISESVVLGFMAGAGFLVALSQIGNLFGLQERGTGNQHLLHRLWLTLADGGPVNSSALGIGLGTVILVLVLRKVTRTYHLPRVDMLLALTVAAIVAARFGWSEPDANGKSIVAVVGSLPAGLPLPHVPEFHLSWLRDVRERLGDRVSGPFGSVCDCQVHRRSDSAEARLQPAVSCGGIGQPRRWLLPMPARVRFTHAFGHQFPGGSGQPMFRRVCGGGGSPGGAPVCGRCAFIPKAALAGILLVTAAGLIDRRRLLRALRASRYDAGLVLVTAFAAVFVSVEFSILIGVAISILMFVPAPPA